MHNDFGPSVAGQHVHVIADSDTRWKWGVTLADRLDPARISTTLLHGRSTPSDRQLLEMGTSADSTQRASIAELVRQLSGTSADVVVLACIGGGVQALLHALARAWEGRETRPVVVTGYVGLVYERVVDGLLLRAGADVVLANSAADARRFRDVFEAVEVDPATVVQTALPFLGGAPHDPTAAGRDRSFTVSFVAQPGVPETREERKYALLQVIQHAIRHPDRSVILKLRGRIGERTTHVEPYHYTSLVPSRQLPDNVQIAYGPMTDILDRTDLCVTVSSTAALEAMHRDIPTAILTDFGIRESLGNHVFLESGALTSWHALHAGAVPKTDPEWSARNGVRDDNAFDGFLRRIAELTDPASTLPPLRPWLNSADAGGYLPELLARYGLHASGAPFFDQRPDAASGRLPRRMLRAIALRAYQAGVRTLEPRVRRMAQL